VPQPRLSRSTVRLASADGSLAGLLPRRSTAVIITSLHVPRTTVMRATRIGTPSGLNTKRPIVVTKLGQAANRQPLPNPMIATLDLTTGSVGGPIPKSITAVRRTTVAASHTIATRDVTSGKMYGTRVRRHGAAPSRTLAAQRRPRNLMIVGLASKIGRPVGLLQRRCIVVTIMTSVATSTTVKKASGTGNEFGRSTNRPTVAIVKVLVVQRLQRLHPSTVTRVGEIGRAAGQSPRNIGVVRRSRVAAILMTVRRALHHHGTWQSRHGAARKKISAVSPRPACPSTAKQATTTGRPAGLLPKSNGVVTMSIGVATQPQSYRSTVLQASPTGSMVGQMPRSIGAVRMKTKAATCPCTGKNASFGVTPTSLPSTDHVQFSTVRETSG